MNRWAALDPGRSKCGLVLVDLDQRVVDVGLVIPPETVAATLRGWNSPTGLTGIVIGDGTGSDRWIRELPAIAPVHSVDERGSTLAARGRYWELWPPRGWRRLVPLGLQTPPGNLDAVAALVLLEKHLRTRCQWPGTPPIG